MNRGIERDRHRYRSVVLGAVLVAVLAPAQPAQAAGHEYWVRTHTGRAICEVNAASATVDESSGVVYGLYDDDTCSSTASLLVAYTNTGTEKWVAENVGPFDDVPAGVAVDPRTHTVLIAATRNNDELLVQAFDAADGHKLWGKGLIATGDASFHTDGLFVDGDSRVVVSGTVTRNSMPSWSTAAFDVLTGATEWHVHYTGLAGLGATATAIAGDPAVNRAYIIGTAFTGSRDNLLTLSYDTTDGQVVWAHEVARLNPTPVGIAVDTTRHDAYALTGHTSSTVATTFAYSSSGAALWNHDYGGTGGVQPRGIAVDTSNGRIYVAGWEASSATTVVDYSASGAQLWTDTDSASTSIPEGIAADVHSHRVYVTSDVIVNSSVTRIVTFADSSAGARLWRDTYGVAGFHAAPGAITDDPTRGEEYVAGSQAGPGNDGLTSLMIAYHH